MENKNKPAYPVGIKNCNDYTIVEGMTKREIFAMAAMQGILSNGGLQLAIYEDCKIDGTTPLNAVAFHAVREADELLKQLDIK